jgi:hypothetical protein
VGFTGTNEQFLLQPGDIVSPIMRPAGIPVPERSGRGRFLAGFRQVSVPVLKIGMTDEIACASKLFTAIPIVVVAVQDVISSTQFRPGDRLVDLQDLARPVTILVSIVPLYESQTDGIGPNRDLSVQLSSKFTNAKRARDHYVIH